MFGIHYLKAGPTDYVIHYQDGRVRRAGAGLAFFYYQPSSSIAVIPIASDDVPFVFNEVTADFQPVTVQGQLTYRISQPDKVASLLDYTVKSRAGQYASEDPEKLPPRLINLVQVLTRDEIARHSLREALRAADRVAAWVLQGLQASPALNALGVEILTLAILAIRPTPELARALEAEAREGLQRQSDQAIADRRYAAVEQERRIKENELNTEIAVEEKRRQIRETKVEADLAVQAKEQQVREARQAGDIRLEEERTRLVAAQATNAQAEADIVAYGIESSLRPLKEVDPSLIQLLALQSADPRLMVSLAMKEIAQNAAKIGQLNISPDLLESLMQER
jgi:hypothetical protein